MKFANRMNQFGEGVFSRLAVMRKNRLAQGKEVYDLSIGAPNIPPTKRIMEVMAEAVMKPANYVYAISDTQQLLEAVVQWYKRRYDVELNPETEICSLLGSQDGLSHIALSIWILGMLCWYQILAILSLPMALVLPGQSCIICH